VALAHKENVAKEITCFDRVPDMNELTYVIPVYNGAKSIERTISSIMEQPSHVPAPRIIIVDDGSTDETWEVLSRYKKCLTILRQATTGPSGARNYGLEAVETEIVCFVDADDYVIGPHQQMVKSSWKENVDLIIGLAAEEDENGIFLATKNKYERGCTSNQMLHHFICDNCVQTATLSWSTAFLRELGGWDETLCGIEDLELAIRAFVQDAKVEISNVPGWVVWNNNAN
jgi:glycosyltransferase involved in cell wall biosynthesis